jgi:hypothetical protein
MARPITLMGKEEPALWAFNLPHKDPARKIKVMKTEPTTQQDDFVSLYRLAFKDYGCRALWNVRELENPTCEDALAITRSLRVEGDLNVRRLAERLEKACHVAH